MRPRRAACRLPRLGAAEEGVASIEWAVIFIPLLLLIFGIIEFAQAYWTWNTMLLAVGDGARYAMVFNSYNSAAGCSGTLQDNTVSVVQQSLIGIADPSDFTISACSTTSTTPATITISASYNFTFLAAGISGPLTLSTQVTVPLL